MSVLAAALAALLEVRQVSVPAGTDGGGGVRIECPAGQTTRIVFPERFMSVKVSAGAQDALGLVPEAARPLGVLRVLPPSHPAQGRVRATGPSGSLVVILQTVATGRGSEIRLVAKPPSATPAPAAATIQDAAPAEHPQETAPAVEEARSGEPGTTAAQPLEAGDVPTPSNPAPAVSPVTSAVPATGNGLALDASDLLRATPVRIGRREGRPGQREMVLDDALKGESSVWLRFTLRKGAKRQVARVWWGAGEISSFAQEPMGEDLKLRVRLPRAELKPDSRLFVAVSGEGEYRFALKDSSFVSFVKGLFF